VFDPLLDIAPPVTDMSAHAEPGWTFLPVAPLIEGGHGYAEVFGELLDSDELVPVFHPFDHGHDPVDSLSRTGTFGPKGFSKGFRNSVDRVTWPPCGMEPCLVSCGGVFRVISQGTAGGGLAHRGSRRQQTRSSTLSSRSTVSMKQILQGNPLRGLATVSQDGNCHWSIAGSIAVADKPLTRTFALYARLLRDCCEGRPVFWVVMSTETLSPTGQKGTRGSGPRRGCLPPAFTPQRPLQQLHPLSGPMPEGRPAATLTGQLTVTEPQGLRSAYHCQFLDTPRHTHLQPVADGRRRC
jgi:hypothetical protein